MVRVDRHGVRYPDCLFEGAAWRYSVIVKCPDCKREAVFHAAALWLLFNRKGWDEHIRNMRKKLRCRQCNRNDRIVRFEKGRGETVHLPLPTDREWKNAVSRFRA